MQWCLGQGLELHCKAILSFEDYAARVIQSWWKHLAGQSRNQRLEPMAKRVLDSQTAAAVIQRTWRRHNVSAYKMRSQNVIGVR